MWNACVILAGGQSQRMGRDKASLIYQDKPFLAHLTANFGGFAEKYIARGQRQELTAPGWESIADIYENCGPMAGIHAALNCCKNDKLICVSCDTPLMDADFFARLLLALQHHGDAAVPVDRHGRVHPLCGIYRKTCLPVLQRQLEKGDYRMLSALSQLQVQYVQIDEEIQERKLKNINTEEDYQELNHEIV